MYHPAVDQGKTRRGRSFGPLAEALRKRGALEEALRVVQDGLADAPDHLPGHLVLSRIRMDQQDWPGAEAALRAALDLDPSHPVVLEGLADLAEATGRMAEGTAWRAVLSDPFQLGGPVDVRGAPPPSSPAAEARDAEVGEPVDFVLTESLAGLYRRQGHLEKAVEVYQALTQLAPDDEALSARHEALRLELLGSRPRPYDSALSGGKSVRTWLAEIASATPIQSLTGKTGYDAFYESPTTPTPQSADFEAFQAWLKGLER